MKRNKNYIILCLSVLTLLLSSCSQEELENKPFADSGKIAIRLSLAQPGITKADTETGEDNLNENLVKTLDVFIYGEGEDACFFYQHILSLRKSGKRRIHSDSERQARTVQPG